MATQAGSLLERADRLVTLAAGLLAWIGAAAIVALMAITIVAVFFRYVLNDPIFGIEDLSIIALTIVAGASVAFGGRHGAHVSVDMLGFGAGRRWTKIADAVMRALTLGILALATWALFDKACGIHKACITSNFSIEHRPFYYFLGVCIGVYAAQILVELLTGLTSRPAPDPSESPR